MESSRICPLLGGRHGNKEVKPWLTLNQAATVLLEHVLPLWF